MKRSEHRKEDTWDLEALYADGALWKEDYDRALSLVEHISYWQGKIGESMEAMLSLLGELETAGMLIENLIIWASLRFESDAGDPDNQKYAGLASALEAKFSQATSWVDPQIMAMDSGKLESWLSDDRFSSYRIFIRKTLHMKDHTLSDSEEHLLSLNSEASSACSDAFHDLNDVDLDFGTINGVRLTHASWQSFMQNPDENVRRDAYKRLYGVYEAHRHVLSRLYSGSVNQDIFEARARKYSSSLEAALYPDKVPQEVYRNLIGTVHDGFRSLHRYYTLRAKLLGKTRLNHYDVYLPMVEDVSSHYSYEEAVSLISDAVAPLGDEYRDTLVNGLGPARWVDRYENEGKRSGAFSSGGYRTMPYILTNYRDDVLSSVFTLIHEGGHSMHSWYSTRNNAFLSYNYTIFEAEVASTFNEELLSRHLISGCTDERMKRYLVASRLDDMVGTLFRQTMFAEFELLVHEEVERGGVATLDFMRKTYRSLLEAYFGPSVVFEPESDLEFLRIPHFYRAFYVYKYATGICASTALADRVLTGGERERNDYIGFLKSGGSHYPIDSLRSAGVDMGRKESVQAAIGRFDALMDILEGK